MRAKASCKDAGLDVPKLEELGTHFRVTISTEQVREASTDETDQRITALLGEAGPLSTTPIARHIRLSPRATLTRLKALKAQGVLVDIGIGPHDPKRQYALAVRNR